MNFLKLLGCFLLLVFANCKSSSKASKPDKFDEGEIFVSSEYCFKPIVDELIKVYQSQYPKTQIHVTYQSYAKCQTDILNDSVSIIFCSSINHEQFQKQFKEEHNFNYKYDLLAFDALVFFTNKNNTLVNYLSLQNIKDVFYKKKAFSYSKFFSDAKVVSSNTKYLIDSFNIEQKKWSNIYPSKNPLEQIKKVKNYPNAYGFVNALWLFFERDKEDFIYQSVKVLGFKNEKNDSIYYPSNKNLTENTYPFFKRMFYVSKVNYVGLASSFVNFLTLEKGQLIFDKAQMIPAKMNFSARLVSMKEE